MGVSRRFFDFVFERAGSGLPRALLHAPSITTTVMILPQVSIRSGRLVLLHTGHVFEMCDVIFSARAVATNSSKHLSLRSLASIECDVPGAASESRVYDASR